MSNKKIKNTLFFERTFEKAQAASIESINDVIIFNEFLGELKPSKKTHYHELDETFDPIYEKMKVLLQKYGFVNGEPETNSKNPDIALIWEIYCCLDCLEYSPYYYEVKEDSAKHHSSAYARVYCIQKEIDFLIKKIKSL
jgi:hypothetical protein